MLQCAGSTILHACPLQVDKVVIPAATEKRPEQQFGFVHFKDQASASKAVTEGKDEKPELLGKTLEVSLGRLFSKPSMATVLVL